MTSVDGCLSVCVCVWIVVTGRVPVPYIALIDGVTMGGVSVLVLIVSLFEHTIICRSLFSAEGDGV